MTWYPCIQNWPRECTNEASKHAYSYGDAKDIVCMLLGIQRDGIILEVRDERVET